MKDIEKLYKEYCESKNIHFQLDNNVTSYDDTTLFCPAGMQQFKDKFKDPDGTTTANIQSCIRLNDLDEIGDGTHMLHFRMMGLFSFGDFTLKEAVEFWIGFIQDKLELKIDYVTIHPDKFMEWQYLYESYNIPIREDEECIWSDGEIGGYCTEFYHNGIEIGNIVNTLGKFIDVGFGFERLDSLVNDLSPKTKIETLVDAINKIIESGYKPGPQKQGYILRKLLRMLYVEGGVVDHLFFENEVTRQQKMKNRYDKLIHKHSDKPKEWWFDTHGIDLDEI